MGQAVAASFASGLGQGIQAGGQAALQQMIRDREANKKLTQERATVAKGYGNTILQMANNVEEQELQKKLKTIAYKLNMNLYSDPQLGVNEVVELGVLDDSTLNPYAEELDITLPEAPQQKEHALSDEEIASRGLDPAPEGYQWTISPTGNVSLEGRSPRVPPKPEISIPERQKKKARDMIIEQANMAGVSFDEFRQNSPENPDVIMYNRLSGSVPIRDDGMRLTDTATTGSLSIPEPEPAIVESTVTSSNDGLRAVNPATGEKLILINGQWQTDQ